MFPSGLVGFDGLEDVGRDDELLPFSQVPQSRQDVLDDLPLVDHGPQALGIGLGIGAFGIALRKPLDEAFRVHFLDDAVDPAEAEGFLDRVVIRDAGLARILLVIDKPDVPFFFVVLPQPGPPLPAVRDVEGLSDFHERVQPFSGWTIWIRLPQVSSKIASVTGPWNRSSPRKTTPFSFSRVYSALMSLDSNEVAGIPASKRAF